MKTACTSQWCYLYRSDDSFHSSVMHKVLPLSAGWTMAQSRKETFLEAHIWSLAQPQKTYRTRWLPALPLGDASEELKREPITGLSINIGNQFKCRMNVPLQKFQRLLYLNSHTSKILWASHLTTKPGFPSSLTFKSPPPQSKWSQSEFVQHNFLNF